MVWFLILDVKQQPCWPPTSFFCLEGCHALLHISASLYWLNPLPSLTLPVIITIKTTFLWLLTVITWLLLLRRKPLSPRMLKKPALYLCLPPSSLAYKETSLSFLIILVHLLPAHSRWLWWRVPTLESSGLDNMSIYHAYFLQPHCSFFCSLPGKYLHFYFTECWPSLFIDL